MGNRFLVFVVFATVMQISPAMQKTTFTPVQTDVMADYHTNDAFKMVAHLEYQKALDIIFTYLKDLVSVICGDQDSLEGSLYTANAFKAEVSAALQIQLDVALMSSQIICPEGYSTIPIAQNAGHLRIQKFVENIYEIIGLAQSQNSTGNLAKIEAFENEMLIAAPELNAIIYNAIRCGKSSYLKLETAIESAEKESLVQLNIAARSISVGIKALSGVVTSKSQAECNRASSAIENAWNQASIALKTDVDIKFGIIDRFIEAFSILQSTIGTDSSVINANKMSAISDRENAIYNTFSSTQHGSCKVDSEKEDEIMAASAAIQRGEETALRGVHEAAVSIFSGIKIVSVNIAHGNHSVCEDDNSIDITHMKEYTACKGVLDSYFNAIQIAQPEASSSINNIRSATYSILIEIFAGIRAGMNLVNEKNYTKIPIEIERAQEATTSATLAVIKNIFIAIFNAQKSHNQTRTAIERARKEALSSAAIVINAFFAGIKILLAQTCPEYRLEGDDCFSSIEAAENVSFSSSRAIVEAIFRAIRILFASSTDSCSCTAT